jgi:DNA-binding MarR family transcriptional regulator
MANLTSKKETGARPSADLRRPAQKRVAHGDFPPLSISRKDLLQDGSDLAFRRLLNSLVAFGDLGLRHRNFYGAYIGVTGSQYMMMTIIAGTPRMTVGQMAKTLSVSNQYVATEVGKLAQKGIVDKTSDPSDRRSMILTLTEKGRSLLRELGPVRRQSNDLMYRSLTRERLNTMQEILDALIADAHIALHELDAPQRRSQRAPSVETFTTDSASTRPERKRT